MKRSTSEPSRAALMAAMVKLGFMEVRTDDGDVDLVLTERGAEMGEEHAFAAAEDWLRSRERLRKRTRGRQQPSRQGRRKTK